MTTSTTVRFYQSGKIIVDHHHHHLFAQINNVRKTVIVLESRTERHKVLSQLPLPIGYATPLLAIWQIHVRNRRSIATIAYRRVLGLLHPSKRLCFRRCLSVCLFVCWQLCAKTSERICMKFSGKVGNGPISRRWTTDWIIGRDPDHRLETGIVYFPDSSLLGYTESGINRLRCATLQCRACTIAMIATMTSLDRRTQDLDAKWMLHLVEFRYKARAPSPQK